MALTKVTKSGLADDSVDASKLEDGTIVAADINDGTITNDKLAGSIANAKLANSSITLNGSALALGASASVLAFDWQSVVTSNTTMVSGKGYFVNTTGGAITWTFSNPTASDELCGFVLKLVNGGSATQTWPASVDWPSATAPTLTTSGTDVLVFITCDGGTTYYGFTAGLALA